MDSIDTSNKSAASERQISQYKPFIDDRKQTNDKNIISKSLSFIAALKHDSWWHIIYNKSTFIHR